MNGQSSAYSQSVPSYLFGRSGGGSGSGGSGGSMYAAAPHHVSQQHRGGDGGAHQHQGATTAAPVPATLSRPPPSATHVIDLLTTQQQGGGGGGSGGGSSRRFQQQSTVQSHRASVNKEGGRSIAETTTTTTTDRHGGGVVGRGVAAAGNAGRYTAPLERQQQRQLPLIVELTSGGGDRSGGEGKDRLDDCRETQPKRYRLETTTTKSNATRPVTVVATTTTASGCHGSADAAATLVRTAAVSDVERGRIGMVVSQQQQQSPAHTAGAVGGGWHSPLPMVGSVTVRVGSNLGNPFTHEKGADGQPLGAGGQPLRCGGSGGSPRGPAATASNAGGVPLSKARDAPRATTNIVDTTTAAKENALGSRYITPIPTASPSGAIRYPAQPPIVKVGGGGGANITKVETHRSSALKLHSTIARTNASEAGGGVSPRPLTAPAHGGGAHIDLTLAGSTTQRAAAQHPLPHAPSPIDGASPRSGEQSPSPISSGGYLGLSPKSTISEALRRVNYPHQPLIPASLLSAAVKPNTTPLPSWIRLLPPQTPREQQQQQPEDVCRRVVDTTISNTLTRYTAIKNDNHKRRRSPTPPRARASGVLAQSPGGCILVFDTSSLIRVVEAGKQLDCVLQRHRIYIPYITLDELDKKSKFLPNRNNNNNNNRAMTPTMRHCRAMRDWLTARMLEDETLQRTAATSKRYHDPAQTTPSSREPRIRIQRHSEIDPAYAYRELNNDDSILGYAVYLRNVRQVTAPIVFVTEDKILELKAMSEQFSAISVLKLLDGF